MPLPSSICSVVYVTISESPETRLVPIFIREISMHKIESREISNRKYLSKTILAYRARQANKFFFFLIARIVFLSIISRISNIDIHSDCHFTEQKIKVKQSVWWQKFSLPKGEITALEIAIFVLCFFL